jgi:DNA (cytosine-5)-methyltransferase 1
LTTLKTISLYSGAGGLDHGFAEAGFDICWANEIDSSACATYRENLGDHIVCGDVLETALPSDLEADVVIGGPPCQGFSVIGKMDQRDPRSAHVFHFFDVVETVGATAFVLENVKSLAVNPRWSSVREALFERACSLGFETKLFLLNAAHFGVPQSRERMFLIGIRGGTPVAPIETTRERPTTVREALAVLPRFGGDGNDGIVKARVVPAAYPIMRPSPYRGALLFNGSGRPLDLDSPAKTIPASMGGNATPIIDQEELEHGAEPWVVAYHQRLKEGRPPLKRAPKRMRRITIQEAAALQTFPPEWTFHGRLVAQLRQVGNAVPPRLAFNVARALKTAMTAATDSGASHLELAA